MLLTTVTARGPIIDKLSPISCNENTSLVPRNCKELSVASVNTRISCSVGIARTISEPLATLKNPAVLVTNGFQTLGWSCDAQRMSSGSKSFVPPA